MYEIKMYEIKTIRSADEIESGNVAEIAVYNWGGEYRPVSRAILAFIPDEGFLFKNLERGTASPRYVHRKKRGCLPRQLP